MELVDVVRALGLVVAFAGAAVTARWNPRGLVTSTQTLLSNASKFVQRHLPWRHQDATVRPAAIQGTASVGLGKATVTAEGVAWAPDGPISIQIEMLRARTESLARKISDLRAEQRQQVEAVRAELSTGLARLGHEFSALRAEHEAAERRADQFDARGLPLIGVGILLTGWPDRWMPTWWAIVLLAIASVVSVRTMARFVADRRAGDASAATREDS